MKKTKKFDDGGMTGGEWVNNGDSGRYVEEAPVAAGISPRVGGPIGADMAGMGGLNELNASSPPATIMPFVAGNNGPEPIRRPMGLMVPRGAGFFPVGAGMAGMKKGGKVKKMAKGGSVSSASKRGDGCAIKGKTKGRFV